MTVAMEPWAEKIQADREALARVSTAERVAEVLRERIIEGALEPGTRLSEQALRQAIPVSRNTLREAFRLLSHERLLVHEFNRGMSVRELEANDVQDLYRMRRIIECSVVTAADDVSAADLAPAWAAVAEGEQAAQESRWPDVGTANMHFHLGLTSLAGSSTRMREIMHRLMAEGRLAFHRMGSPRDFYEPYLGWNRKILSMLERGASGEAGAELARYLSNAEGQILETYRQ